MVSGVAKTYRNDCRRKFDFLSEPVRPVLIC
jgi:hypothetical protein